LCATNKIAKIGGVRHTGSASYGTRYGYGVCLRSRVDVRAAQKVP
jgi:hypothetical protein